jgi:hypothetical protein
LVMLTLTTSQARLALSRQPLTYSTERLSTRILSFVCLNKYFKRYKVVLVHNPPHPA